jgi:hypothetical protein
LLVHTLVPLTTYPPSTLVDRERELAAHDAGQDLLALGLRAEAQQQRSALAVGHPVRADRRAGGQHLLEDDVALEEAPLVSAILLRPRHADPAPRAHAARELTVESAPGFRALHGRGAAELLGKEMADLLPEALGFWRQVAEGEAEGGRHAGSSSHGARRRNRVTTARPGAIVRGHESRNRAQHADEGRAL